MKSTPQNPTVQVEPTVSLVRGLPEYHIAKYVLSMLEFVKAKGPFELTVAKKITGHGGHHHGAELKGIKYNAVRLTVQSSDNNSRYLCYLSSKEMKPKAILTMIDSKLSDGKFERSMLKDIARPVRAKGLGNVGEVLEAALAAASQPKKNVSLAGSADDEDVVAMIIIAIRLRHGMDGFDGDSFHEVIRSYATDASNRAAGQLLRRIVENGYLSSEGTNGNKVYRMAEKGLRLLAEHDKSVTESAASALKITDANELYKGLADLEVKARKHAAAAQRLAELNGKIGKADSRIDKMCRELNAARLVRDNLIGESINEQKILDDPDLVSARETYKEIQIRLKGA